jgi:hypothetical protein
MAAIFTPGLKVAADTMIVKDRRLPIEGDVLVSVGQRVSSNTIVARTELPGKVYPVNVANQLGIGASRLKSFMLKGIGSAVNEGEVVAKTNGFMGLFASQAKAIISGTIESISTVSGEVIFQAHPIPVEIDAYIDGVIVDVHSEEGCAIQNRGCLIQGIFGLGGEVKGTLTMGVEQSTARLTPTCLNEDMAGKIVVGGSYLPIETVQRAVDLGISGIVTGGFDYDDIKDLLGYEIGVAITGGESLGLTIIVTEGFGQIEMAPGTFKLLQSHEGSKASINGATQIRAGVIRPEVVITTVDPLANSERWQAPEPTGIQLGDTIRAIRAPYFGRIGRVKSLPVELLQLESETRVRIMEVEFDDGEMAMLPRANVESIER